MIKYLTLAVIPVVQGVQKIAEHTWVATISASVCLLIEAMLRLWRTEEKWILYRSTNNTLMSEKRQYVTSKGIYKNANDPCEILVERVESIIDDEAHKWVATFKEKKEDPAVDNMRRKVTVSNGEFNTSQALFQQRISVQNVICLLLTSVVQ